MGTGVRGAKHVNYDIRGLSYASIKDVGGLYKHT